MCCSPAEHWNPAVSSNKDHTLFKGRSNMFMNSISSLCSLYHSPPRYFPRYLFPVFFHPKALSPLCFFFWLFHSGSALPPVTLSVSFLCYHRPTAQTMDLCVPFWMNIHVFHLPPSQYLAEVCVYLRVLIMTLQCFFWNICPYKSGLKHHYDLIILLQVRRFSCLYKLSRGLWLFLVRAISVAEVSHGLSIPGNVQG